ncbi:MAG: polysaccharide deacetylase family protein [Candidatus Omnitrophica bacterium]|nr:polysaccharide deacetylase family protein [Candidatus Omnitrophota bacterium]
MRRWSYHLPILGYHRVGAFRGDHVPTVSPQAFERQMMCLARWKFHVVGLEELLRTPAGREALPRRSVVITFDDGYEETCTVAWPILKRFGFSATVFVATEEIGGPGFATWEQLAAMADGGLTIGSHTAHHCYLPDAQPSQVTEEIVRSKQALEARLGQPVDFLSYPIGGFTPHAQQAASLAGYRAAVTTNRYSRDAAMAPFALRRIKVTERDRWPWLFWAKVSGYYDAFRKLKPPG